jgi:hypothetical protein
MYHLEFLSHYRGLETTSADHYLSEKAGVASEADDCLPLKDIDGSACGVLARRIVYTTNRS